MTRQGVRLQGGAGLLLPDKIGRNARFSSRAMSQSSERNSQRMMVPMTFRLDNLYENSRHLPPRPAKGLKKAPTTSKSSALGIDDMKIHGLDGGDCMFSQVKPDAIPSPGNGGSWRFGDRVV